MSTPVVLSLNQTNAIYQVIRMAESMIYNRTGVRFELLVKMPSEIDKKPIDLMHVVAAALVVDPAYYHNNSRKQEHAFMRHIATDLLKKYFPDMTHHDIGKLMGDKHHTTITNSIDVCQKLMEGNDVHFCNQYSKALNAVETWLKD